MTIRSPLNLFIHGRTCVISDVAHIILLTHGADTGVAIKSAATLEPLLAGVKAGDVHGVKKHLLIWDKLRNGKCDFGMISNAGAGGLHIQGVEGKYYDEPLPPKDALTWYERLRAVSSDC